MPLDSPSDVRTRRFTQPTSRLPFQRAQQRVTDNRRVGVSGRIYNIFIFMTYRHLLERFCSKCLTRCGALCRPRHAAKMACKFTFDADFISFLKLSIYSLVLPVRPEKSKEVASNFQPSVWRHATNFLQKFLVLRQPSMRPIMEDQQQVCPVLLGRKMLRIAQVVPHPKRHPRAAHRSRAPDAADKPRAHDKANRDEGHFYSGGDIPRGQ